MLWLLSLFMAISGQVSGWEIFENTKFKWEWKEKLGAEVEVPTFDAKIKKLDGQEITLTGHYLPLKMNGNTIILSKFTYSSCFFCSNGVGQESVAEVNFIKELKPLEGDEIITVKGRLKLNKNDYDHLVFILEEASIIE